MSSRPETGVSKAHGGISVLLNFTDFPSPLYRFIALEGRSLVSPSNDGYCRVTYLWRISTWLLSVVRNPRFTRARISERPPPVDPVDRNTCVRRLLLFIIHALYQNKRLVTVRG